MMILRARGKGDRGLSDHARGGCTALAASLAAAELPIVMCWDLCVEFCQPPAQCVRSVNYECRGAGCWLLKPGVLT